MNPADLSERVTENTATNESHRDFLIVLIGGIILFSLIWHFSTPSSKTIQQNTGRTPAQLPPSKDTKLQGIDVSHWQGKIDWQHVTQSGIQFAFLKATQGINHPDARFTENRDAVEKLGLTYGAYHFFDPTQDATQQAMVYLKRISTSQSILPPVLDVEITAGVDSKTLQQGVKTWLQHVQKETKCQPVIYASPAFWNTHLGKDLNDYRLWLADYASSPRLPTGIESWLFWQYSESGKVSGIGGEVDSDVYHGSLDQLNNLKCNLKQSV